MTTTAQTWFYQPPENQAYLVTERLNATFWAARVVGAYWRCVRAEPPFKAEGYWGEHVLEMEWEPGEWLALKGPDGANLDDLVKAISKRILAYPATLAYRDSDGHQIVEWHRDGGQKRWSEVQGRPEFVQPRRLNSGQRR